MPERKIWELGAIVCRILGLTFNEDELTRIFNKLVTVDDCRSLTPDHKHSLLVHLCSSPNAASKYIDKILKKRFEPYKGRVKGIDQRVLCQLIEEGEGVDGVPLQALVWFAVRKDHEEIKDIDERVFGAVHMREHQALRFYESLSRILPFSKPEDVINELEDARSANKKLAAKCKKLDGKIRDLIKDMETIKREKSGADMALIQHRKLNERLKRESDNLAIDSLLKKIETQKKEIEFLKGRIRRLTGGLMKEGRSHETSNTPVDFPDRRKDNGLIAPEDRDGVNEETISLSLEGIKVAFVGGKDSLIPHYRQIVRDSGGIFYSHCGKKSSNGKGKLERLVDKVDVVFCPVDINSHYACESIKNACKLRNKPYYFLPRSSLNTFKGALVEFARAGPLESSTEIRNLN